MRISAIIQARMTSQRFPGKVLAPFLGRPLLAHVVERLRQIPGALPVVLATSRDEADDPLALYAQSLGVGVVRGPLENVLGRFALAVAQHPCEAFFRVCADSPLLEPFLFVRALEVYSGGDFDLVTNVFPRTYPAGLSVELLRAETFLALEKVTTDPQDREHVTRYYYGHPEACRIQNIESARPADPGLKLAVDEIGDLERLARWKQDKGSWACTEFRT